MIIDFLLFVLRSLAMFANIIFEVPSLSLEFDGELSHVSVEHALTLTFHHHALII